MTISRHTMITALTVLTVIVLPLVGAVALPVWATYWIGLFLAVHIMRRTDRNPAANSCYALCVFIAITFNALISNHSVSAARILLTAWIFALLFAMKASLGIWIIKTVDKYLAKSQTETV